MHIKTFYDELGVGRDADGAAIKHAFKEIAKVYHPDKNPPEKQACTKPTLFIEIEDGCCLSSGVTKVL